MADVFISYTTIDRDWALWIAKELEALGYTPYVHELATTKGNNDTDDLHAWLGRRYDHVLCVVSDEYLDASQQLIPALWDEGKKRPGSVLFIGVKPGVLWILKGMKQCELDGLPEDQARRRLRAFMSDPATFAEDVERYSTVETAAVARPACEPLIVAQSPGSRPRADRAIDISRGVEGELSGVDRKRETVEFAVSNPSTVRGGNPFLAEVWAFLPHDREIAVGRAHEADDFHAGASAMVARGSRLKIELQAWPCRVEPAIQFMAWAGCVTNVSFRVWPDTEKANTTILADCKISMGRRRLGVIPFDFTIGEHLGEIKVTRGKRRKAFASYASKDRSRVLATVQGLEKFVDVFMDVHNLKSGASYPSGLLQQIDASDVLYLFWSRHAKQSEWVEREWRYGFERRGIHFIDPVPLVDPRKVPPPPELAEEKHFNDWTLAYLEYEKSRGVLSRLRSWCGLD